MLTGENSRQFVPKGTPHPAKVTLEFSRPIGMRDLGYPISTRINHVANDDEACSAPVELEQIQNRLFS